MKERLFIIISLALFIGVLIALNAASFVRLEREKDREFSPNRSTLNAGATGTRAFYELLRATGKDVVRWQEPPSALFNSSGKSVKTFVVVGELLQNFTETETKDLTDWVKKGGRLVIIDRSPDKKLLPTESAWEISTSGGGVSFFDTADPANVKEMTDRVTAFRPLQPTTFTKNVEAVMPSRFASSIELKFQSWEEQPTSSDADLTTAETPPESAAGEPLPAEPPTPAPPKSEFFAQPDEDIPPPKPKPVATASNKASGQGAGSGNDASEPPPPKVSGKSAPNYTPPPVPKATPRRSIFDEIFGDDEEYEPQATPMSAPPRYTHSAPVIHLAEKGKNLLVDYPFGAGQIVLLSDPYIVANGGIQLADNVQLLQNITDNGGTIAFDEYHQGYGARGTQLFQYFANTPFVAIFWQFAALIALFVWSRGRRFARPLPLPNPDRRSKLEYVAAMAELQKRTRSYDLAIETIYTRARRNISRIVGVDNTTIKTSDLAEIVAERIKTDPLEVRRVFESCEDIIHGEKTSVRKVLDLIEKLREIETKLGLRRN